MEEYPDPVPAAAATTADRSFVVPLSARTAPQLEQMACDLLDFIQKRGPATIDLAALAYTLQVGRDAMAQRVGFVVSSVGQLAEKLVAYIDGERSIEHSSSELLRAWMNGREVDWRQLYGEVLPRRMSLPTYPFARERYWAALGSAGRVQQPATIATALRSFESLLDAIDETGPVPHDFERLLDDIY